MSKEYPPGYVIGINYVPVVNDDWPNNAAKGFICGTIPYNDAPCIAYTSASSRAAGRYNIDQYAPSTFASCCNGPIINITQPVTNPANPSFGATCLAYCPVDFGRTLSLDGGFAGDYWDCITNVTRGTSKPPGEVYGTVTCGWVGTSLHDQCEVSISAVSAYTGSQVSMYPFSQLNWSSPTVAASVSKTFAPCPSQAMTTEEFYGISSTSTTRPVSTPTSQSRTSLGTLRISGTGISVNSIVLMLMFAIFL